MERLTPMGQMFKVILFIAVIIISLITGWVALDETKNSAENFCKDKIGIVNTCDYDNYTIFGFIPLPHDCYDINCSFQHEDLNTTEVK